MKTNNELKAMNMTADGDVGYAVHPNAMPASQEKAPYLGHTITSGSYSQDDIAQMMAASRGCPFGAEEIKRVWNATGNYILDRMPKDPRPYDLYFVKLKPAISGKFPSADAPFDPKRNTLCVAATPSDRIKNALAGSSPIPTESAGLFPELTNVSWGGRSMTVKSGERFEIDGVFLTLGAGDEHAALILPGNGGTVTVTLAAFAEGNWQRLWGELSQPVAACENATLKVWTHGDDPKSPLKELSLRNVTVLADDTPPVPAPTITAAGTQGCEPGTIEAPGGVVEVRGTNLETATVIDLLVGEDGAPVEDMELWQSLTATYDAEGEVLATNGVIEDSAPQSFGMVRVTTAGGTAVYPVQYSVH